MRILKLVLVLGIIAAGVIAAKNWFVEKAIIKALQHSLGLSSEIKSTNLALSTTSLHLKGLIIDQPDGFQNNDFIQVKELLVQVVLSDCLKRFYHIKEGILHIENLVIVKNEQGAYNTSRLSRTTSTNRRRFGGKASPKEGALRWKIDQLRIQIDKVSFVDYSYGKAVGARRSTYVLDLDEEFQNIDGAPELIQLILAKALLKTPLSQLVSGIMKNKLQEFKAAENSVSEVLQKPVQEVKNIVGVS